MYSSSRDLAMRSRHYRIAASALAEQIVPMRPTTLILTLIVAATGGSAWANSSLKSTMRSWKAEAATMDRMLIGGTAFDSAEAERILHGFEADSQALIARMSGTSVQARDVRVRFEKFSSDVQSAIETVGSREKMKARYAQLRIDCRSCHDVYAN
jgi:cytochrome c556